MRLKLAILFCFSMNFMFGQDTIVVQSLTFDSQTRDTMIQFPEGDHNEYRKIVMEYTMRCKDGLVSTGTDRNKGCGEWDFSCNTSIIDSSVVDSVSAEHPNYIITGFEGEIFDYVESPTYTYYESILRETSGLGNDGDVSAFNSNEQNQLCGTNQANKQYYLYPPSEFEEVNTGMLSGIKFDFTEFYHLLPYMKVKVAVTQQSAINGEMVNDLNFKEVYFDNFDFGSDGVGNMYFYNEIEYDKESNLIFEISHEEEMSFESNCWNTSQELEQSSMRSIPGDRYIDLNETYNVEIPVDNMRAIEDEVTVCFWSYGNPGALPKATTIFNATDEDNNRQLNVHLPWSDSNIYWDCGNDGNGYDRISKGSNPAQFAGKWNHWAFTKNANQGVMKIFLNGEEWASGTGKNKTIDIQNFMIGSFLQNDRYYNGFMDDFIVADRALDAVEIKDLMYRVIDSGLSSFENIVAYYDFNEQAGLTVIDHSLAGLESSFSADPIRQDYRARDIFKNYVIANNRPNISLIMDADVAVTELTVIDSIENAPNQVVEYIVEGTDIVPLDPLIVWEAGDMPVFNEEGEVIDVVNVSTEEQIFVFDLDYFRKTPGKFEIMSFVTPYGIGLDFGDDGKTWEFDLTDFGPILKGEKRLLMDRGGQWQEEMDIRFLFIEGTPSRDVLSIDQTWPVSSEGYQRILNNDVFEPRTFKKHSGTEQAKLRVAITGHGQEGEFIRRNHFVNIDGGESEYQWQVWKECSDNAVFPQGGTWIYDRAGWCPGQPTQLNEWEIGNQIETLEDVQIDYGMTGASGNSNYIVSIQHVQYGEPNFENDVALDRIISPTKDVEFTRLNPICDNPVVRIKNEGKNNLTRATISYGVEGRELLEYEWEGNLSYLSTEEVVLPAFGSGRWEAGTKFIAMVDNPNGANDESPGNNRREEDFFSVPFIFGDFVIQMKTNSFQNETKWFLHDADGQVVASRETGLQPNTTYLDTISGLNGCYHLQFTDSDQDGISWWANNDGNGFIRVKDIFGTWETLQPDFGQEISYRFNTGMLVNTTNELNEKEIAVFPNPSSGQFNLSLKGFEPTLKIRVYNTEGKLMQSIERQDVSKILDISTLDISDFPNGLYILELNTETFHRSIQLIKQ